MLVVASLCLHTFVRWCSGWLLSSPNSSLWKKQNVRAEVMTTWRYQTHNSVPVLYVSIKFSVNETKESIKAYGQTNGCHWPFVMVAVVLMTFPHGDVDVLFLVWCLVRAVACLGAILNVNLNLKIILFCVTCELSGNSLIFCNMRQNETSCHVCV